MFRIVVIGGTGYAGSAIVAEAAVRGHEATAFSRSAPAAPVPGVHYVQGDATDEAALSSRVGRPAVDLSAFGPTAAWTCNRHGGRPADTGRAGYQ